MKEMYRNDIRKGDSVEISLMIMKILSREGDILIAYIGDKTGDIKAQIKDGTDGLKIGAVIKCSGILDRIFEVTEFEKTEDYCIDDFLPCIETPIENIMKEIEEITKNELKSEECISLNNYFFKNEEFLEKFKKGIGGVSQHHNYRGGLAEHTLNSMYLTQKIAERYNCRNKEIAVLGAKLHDIGKTEELFVDGPFSYTLRGEIEGHIVIGVTMLEEAFNSKPGFYSEDFKERIKGCIIQHHGKLEYGSPRPLNMEEAYIVHFADYIDATMNKIGIIKKDIEPMTWSEYDRRIGTKLYL